MSSYKIHEPVSLAFLLIALYILKVDLSILQLIGSWIFGTLILSPDLDADYSRPKNRIGVLRWLFIPFKHRGILHNPVTWACILLICFHYGYTWVGIGLFCSAMIHIMLDKL